MGALALHCKKNGNIYSSKTRTLLKKTKIEKCYISVRKIDIENIPTVLSSWGQNLTKI